MIGKLRKKSLPLIIALVVTLSSGVVFWNRRDLADSSYLTSLDMRWIDALFRYRGPQSPGTEVVIVGIDNSTLARLGSFRTLSHDNLATLIDRLADAGPRVIGLDIVFSDQDTSNAEHDRRFVAAVQHARNVVLGIYLELETTTGKRSQTSPMDSGLEDIAISKAVFPVENRLDGRPREPIDLIKGRTLVMDMPDLTNAAASFGFVNFHVNDEGRLRHQPQFIEYKGTTLPIHRSSVASLVPRYAFTGREHFQ